MSKQDILSVLQTLMFESLLWPSAKRNNIQAWVHIIYNGKQKY
jgi:hypothetical protein